MLAYTVEKTSQSFKPYFFILPKKHTNRKKWYFLNSFFTRYRYSLNKKFIKGETTHYAKIYFYIFLSFFIFPSPPGFKWRRSYYKKIWLRTFPYRWYYYLWGLHRFLTSSKSSDHINSLALEENTEQEEEEKDNLPSEDNSSPSLLEKEENVEGKSSFLTQEESTDEESESFRKGRGIRPCPFS